MDTGKFGWAGPLEEERALERVSDQLTDWSMFTDAKRRHNEELVAASAYNTFNDFHDALVKEYPFDAGWAFWLQVERTYGHTSNQTFHSALTDEKQVRPGPQDDGDCHLPGALVRMLDGSSKPISQIRMFEKVLTAEGNPGLVTCLMAKPVNEPLYRVSLWGHYGVETTGEHPLLTERGYVKAKEVREDDWVAMPKHFCWQPMQSKILMTGQHVLVGSHRRQQVLFGELNPNWSDNLHASTQVPDVIELDARFGRLVGLYLAEGSASIERRCGKLVWSFHRDEKHLQRFVQQYFGDLGIQTAVVAKSQCTQVVVNSCRWVYLFRSLCGYKSHGKRMHPDLWCGPPEFQEAVLRGWLEGDGYQRRNDTQGVTVSRQLAIDMHAIAQAMGRMPVIRRSQAKLSHGVKSRRPRYDVIFSTDTNHNYQREWRCRETGTHVFRKVRAIESRMYEGNVYNITVERDNSYVVDGISFHNCVGYAATLSCCDLQADETYVKGEPQSVFIPYVPYTYQGGRIAMGWYSGAGSTGGAQLKFDLDGGFLPCDLEGLSGRSNEPHEPGESEIRRWNRKSVHEPWLVHGRKHLLTAGSRVPGAGDAKRAVVELHQPLTIASNWGFRKSHTDSKYGITIWRRSGSWAHQMSIRGIFEIKGTWFVYVGNQWGLNYHGTVGAGFPHGGFVVAFDEFERWAREAYIVARGAVTGRTVTLVDWSMF